MQKNYTFNFLFALCSFLTKENYNSAMNSFYSFKANLQISWQSILLQILDIKINICWCFVFLIFKQTIYLSMILYPMLCFLRKLISHCLLLRPIKWDWSFRQQCTYLENPYKSQELISSPKIDGNKVMACVLLKWKTT